MFSGLKVIYAREELPHDFFHQDSVFLMGPTPRSSDVRSWRPGAIQYFDKSGFNGYILCPEDRPDSDGITRFRGDYDDQLDWEGYGLAACRVIMAYVPRNMANMPALTTNAEWGEWKDSGKVVLGSPTDAEKNRYLEHYARKLGVPLATTMEDTVAATFELLRSLNDPACVFCKIAIKDERCQIEWRGRDSIVITPLGPVVPGHRLVIPRIHVSDAFVSPAITGRTVNDASRYAQEMGLGDCNVITSVGQNATQTVFHLHVHLVPRRAGDGLALPWTGQVRANG